MEKRKLGATVLGTPLTNHSDSELVGVTKNPWGPGKQGKLGGAFETWSNVSFAPEF